MATPPPPRALLQRAPVAASAGGRAVPAQGAPATQAGQVQPPPGLSSSSSAAAAPAAAAPDAADAHCLLDAGTWQLMPAAVADLLSPTNAHFTVAAALGPQGLGKSSLLNRLLGLHSCTLDKGVPSGGAAHPPPAFPVAAAAALAPGRHCTCGVALRVSGDRVIALDTQPLFSASVLEEMAERWEAQPPAALAATAVAAAADAKASAVPFEGVAHLAQLQLAVLLLSCCHRLLLFCDGLDDRRAWEAAATAEMLARGVPDPSLPAAAAAAAGAASGGGAAGAAPARAPPPVEHLAEVVFVHVLPEGAPPPTAAQLQRLEGQLDSAFASSRLRRPGALRHSEHLQGGSPAAGAAAEPRMSYWVLPALPSGNSSSSSSDGSSPAEQAWAALVAALLARPCPPFARRCSEREWLRGVAGDSWRAVRKSPDIATLFSRHVRTVLKSAGGWALVRPPPSA